MAVLYGATLFQTSGNAQNYNYDLIGKNSEAFTLGDPIVNSSGQAIVGGTTGAVIGICAKTVTMASTNVGGANVTVPYIPVDETTEFLMGTNSDLTGNSTNGGTYYKLTGNTTATVQVDTTNSAQTTTSRVVMIKKVDPNNIGGSGSGSGLRQCTVVFVRRPTWIDQ
jgi:hypothetical protein